MKTLLKIFGVIVVGFLTCSTALSQPIRYNGSNRIVQYADSMSFFKNGRFRGNTLYNLGSIVFDSSSNARAIDLSARDGGNSSFYWIYSNGSNAWEEDGTFNSNRSVFRPLTSWPGMTVYPYGTSAGNTGAMATTELAANGTNYTGWKAPDTLGYNIIYTMPSDTGAVSTVLTRGVGNRLTWATGGGGSDTVASRNYSNSLYLKNADSTSIRNYSSSLYLKNADSTTLKNSLLKNADSATIRNYSNSLYLKNADSTSIRNYSTSIYAPKSSPTFSGTVTTPLGAGTVRSSAGGVLSSTASDTVGLGTSLWAKAPKATPTFTGTVTAETLKVSSSNGTVDNHPVAQFTNNSGSNLNSIILADGQGSTMFDVRANGDIYVKNDKTGTVRATAGTISYTASDTVGLGASLYGKQSLSTIGLRALDTTGIADGKVIKYDAGLGKWAVRNDSLGAGGTGLVASDSVLMRGYSNSLYAPKIAPTLTGTVTAESLYVVNGASYAGSYVGKFKNDAQSANTSLIIGTSQGNTIFDARADGSLNIKNTYTGTLRATSGAISATASDTVGLASALAGKQASGTYLVPADSTTQRTYSGTLYLKNADSTTLKNSLLKNADSTSIRNYSGTLYLKNTDSTTQRTYSNSLYLKNADSTTQRTYSNSLYLKNADSTTQRTYSTSLYQPKDADLTTLAAPSNWSIYYTNGSAAQTALTVGAAGTRLSGNGVTSAPTWIASDTVGLGTALFNKASLKDTASKAFGFYNITAADSAICFTVFKAGTSIRSIKAIRAGGTAAIINVTKNGTSDLLTANYTTSTSLASAGTLQNNTGLATDDIIRVTVRSVTGTVTEVFVQILYDYSQ